MTDWRDQYVDLEYSFIGDEDASRLYDRYPKLPRTSDDDCITCSKKGMYKFRGNEGGGR